MLKIYCFDFKINILYLQYINLLNFNFYEKNSIFMFIE